MFIQLSMLYKFINNKLKYVIKVNHFKILLYKIYLFIYLFIIFFFLKKKKIKISILWS